MPEFLIDPKDIKAKQIFESCYWDNVRPYIIDCRVRNVSLHSGRNMILIDIPLSKISPETKSVINQVIDRLIRR